MDTNKFGVPYHSYHLYFSDIYDARYEIENCVRGCYTGCNTYSELADFIKNLGERLSRYADYLRTKKDEPDEDEDDK